MNSEIVHGRLASTSNFITTGENRSDFDSVNDRGHVQSILSRMGVALPCSFRSDFPILIAVSQYFPLWAERGEDSAGMV